MNIGRVNWSLIFVVLSFTVLFGLILFIVDSLLGAFVGKLAGDFGPIITVIISLGLLFLSVFLFKLGLEKKSS